MNNQIFEEESWASYDSFEFPNVKVYLKPKINSEEHADK